MAAGAIGAVSTGGRHRRRRRAVMSDINVTPFVDVMLVLLIVFMVSAPLMTLSITVDLPDARGGTADNSEQNPLFVTLKKKGSGSCTSQTDFYLGETAMAPEDIEAKLRAIKSAPGQGGQGPAKVWVRADRDVCYVEVARILGELRDAGMAAALKIDPPKDGD
jgi:biopolymer transport protein TolR